MKRYTDRWPLTTDEKAQIDALPFGRDWTKLLINSTDIEGGESQDHGHVRIAFTRSMAGDLVAELQESDLDGQGFFGGWVRFSATTKGVARAGADPEEMYVEAPLFRGARAQDFADGLAYFRVLAGESLRRQVDAMHECAREMWKDANEDDEGECPTAPQSDERLCPLCAIERGGSWAVGHEAEPEALRCAICGATAFLYLPTDFGLDSDLVRRERSERLSWESAEGSETTPTDPDLAAILALGPRETYTRFVLDAREFTGREDDQHSLRIHAYHDSDGLIDVTLQEFSVETSGEWRTIVRDPEGEARLEIPVDRVHVADALRGVQGWVERERGCLTRHREERGAERKVAA